MQTPEQLARQSIDALLTAAGWALQNRDHLDRNAALGVAVREFPLPAGPCDYLLFVAGKAAGVIEAKKTGVTLSGVAEQSEKYMLSLPEHLARWDDLLVYDYESTGAETFFCNRRDPKPRAALRSNWPRSCSVQPAAVSSASICCRASCSGEGKAGVLC